jgi:hypothetical protein
LAALLGLFGLFTPAASASTTRYLHEGDYGRTIHVSRGDVLKVRLPNGSSGGYHQPQTSDGGIVQRTNAAGGYPTDYIARARFVAHHQGTADLTASTDYSCLHQQPQCEIAQREWIVHVVVR